MQFLRITRYLEELGKARKEAEQQIAANPILKLETLLAAFHASVSIKIAGKGRNKHHSMSRTAFSKELEDRSSYDPRFPKMTEAAAMRKMQQHASIRAWNEKVREEKRTKHLNKLARRMRQQLAAAAATKDGNNPQTV